MSWTSKLTMKLSFSSIYINFSTNATCLGLIWSGISTTGIGNCQAPPFLKDPWRDALKLLGKYKGLASVSVANGKTCLLWDDLWNGQVRKLKYQSCIPSQKTKQSVYIKPWCPWYTWSLQPSCFSWSLFENARSATTISNLERSELNDNWGDIWGSTHYSSSRAYKSLTGTSQVEPIFKSLWKTSC